MWAGLEGRAGLLQNTGQVSNYRLLIICVRLRLDSNLRGSWRGLGSWATQCTV